METLARWLALILGWLISGKFLADNGRSALELDRVDKALRAARDNRARPVADRLHDAQQRGLYRVSGKPSDD